MRPSSPGLGLQVSSLRGQCHRGGTVHPRGLPLSPDILEDTHPGVSVGGGDRAEKGRTRHAGRRRALAGTRHAGVSPPRHRDSQRAQRGAPGDDVLGTRPIAQVAPSLPLPGGRASSTAAKPAESPRRIYRKPPKQQAVGAAQAKGTSVWTRTGRVRVTYLAATGLSRTWRLGARWPAAERRKQTAERAISQRPVRVRATRAGEANPELRSHADCGAQRYPSRWTRRWTPEGCSSLALHKKYVFGKAT